MYLSSRRRLTLAAAHSTLAIVLATAAVPAVAQSSPPDVSAPATSDQAPSVADSLQADQSSEETNVGSEIVVTGSRIPRANLETGQPSLTVDSQLIEQRGYSNIADALQELPSFGVPGSSRAGAQAGAFGSGQSFVNFFGLGDQRTLTIVNGRRFVSSNTSSIFGPTGSGSQVDLNVIPTLLIDRVETIAVGGAPIYGSDAVAGTINIITKRKFSGFQLDGQYGISERGDAREYRVRTLAGLNFADGRGNLTVSGEYNKQAGLTLTDRPKSRLNSSFTTPLDPDSPFDNVYIADRRIPALSEFGAPLVTDFFPISPGQVADFGFQPSVTNAAGQALAFDSTGNLVPIDFGQQTGNLINFNGGNGFVLPGNLLTPIRRYLGTALAEFAITDRVRLFGEAWYANSKGSQLREQPVYNTALFDSAGAPDGNFILSVNNPYLSASARDTIVAALASNPAADAQDTFYLGRANTDLISGAGSSTVELYRFVTGVDGTFQALGKDMKFEMVGNYGRSTTQGSERVLVQQNFANALNAVRDASGNVVCAPGAVNAAIPTISSTCAPINPFGQQISQAAQDYVTTTANPRATNEQWVVTTSLSGELFDLFGRGIGYAVGYEHRNEKASFDPGAFYFGEVDPTDPTGGRTQFGRSIPIDPVSGQFNTDEVFGELNVPLLGENQRVPLIHSLDLHGAGRYIDNSLAGGDWTYTGDVRWELFRGIALRANYTRSVRAPAVTELFNPTSQIFTTANDPCDSRFIGGGPNPANRAANCAAAGLPGNFQSNIVDFTARGTLSGNTALQNEKADAKTFGVVLRPDFLRGFSATADWVDIKLKGAIQTLDADQVLEGCYDSGSYPNALCSNFTRDGGGQITFIQTGYANAASTQFRGLVTQIAYQTPTPFLGAESAINVVGNYQYTARLETRVGDGDVTTLRNSIGYAPHKATVSATYTNSGLSLSGQWLYYGKTKVDPDQPDSAYQYPTVRAISYFNSTISYDINRQFGIRLIVDNVFDQDTPFPTPAGGGTVTYFDGILGRAFKLGASLKL
ncbi:TonB-dependent receptor [Sphingomonas sp. PB2P19]|uniref:TonB-dependent receptor domain-containing protein n=1 Tax=Sphingomonas rhamnosi TaxID=3096156 RepID=UPI002FCBBB6C